MRPRIAWTIFCKELLDTLRDRRTLFMMIGVPILLYPGLILLSLQVAVMQHEHLERTVSRVVIDSAWPQVRLWLQDVPKIRIVESDKPDADLNLGEVQVVVRTPNLDPTAIEQRRTAQVHLHYDATNFESLDGALRVKTVLDDVAEHLLQARLVAAGLDNAYIEPLRVEQVNVAPPAKTTGNLLGLTLPVLIVIMIALGAFYPAVDLTAGEKERGTFETLLSTPASKLDIVIGKFLAVYVLALLTGFLNLASMGATFAVMLGQVKPMFEQDFALEFSLPFASIVWIVLILLPLGGLISAVMMSIAVYAKSFKDAQNFVTPFFLLLMLPAVLAAMPGAELNAASACVPVLNVVLLFRSLMTGAATLALSTTVLATTILYAGLALAFAAWLFHREDVVLADKTPPLFAPRRKHTGLSEAPSYGAAVMLYCVLFALLFFVGPHLQAIHLIGGILLVQWGLILLPSLIFLKLNRIDPYAVLSLRGASPRGWLGTALLCIGAVFLLIEIGVLNNRLLPAPQAMEEFFKTLFAQDQAAASRLWVLLLTVAVTPAICEEVLFRGVLLSGVRNRLPNAAAIAFVGVLFGAYHMTLYKLLPTSIIGMLLTYVCLRSASLFPSMVMHACINGFSVLVITGNLPAWLIKGMDLPSLEANGLPWPLLLVGFGFLLCGVALLESSARQRHTG